MRLLLLFLVLSLVLSLAPPILADQSNTKVTLHAQAPIANACIEGPLYRQVPCSRYNVFWPEGEGAFVYLGVGQVDSAGIRGLSCGVEYPADIGVISWNLCSGGLQFPNGPSGGDPWPASGGGNRITWANCQDTVILPDDVHAVAGYFYMYAYGAGSLVITPNNNLFSGPELKVADCMAVESSIPFDQAAILGFGGETGFNPCFTQIPVDVNPHRCPNKLNLKSDQRLLVALLGTMNSRIDQVDVETVRIGGVAPDRSRIQDVSAPASSDCSCQNGMKDGYEDLVLSFPLDEVLQALDPSIGEDIQLGVTGAYTDGNSFSGLGCFRVFGDKIANAGVSPDDPAPAPGEGTGIGLEVVSGPTEARQRLSYELPSPSRGGINVYSVTGRLVDRLVTFSGTEGRHEVQWDATRLPGGVYFYRMEANGRTLAAKLVLIR